MTLLATLFSSRGRPRASAAAPLLSQAGLLLPLLLVPAVLSFGLAGVFSVRTSATGTASASADLHPADEATPAWLSAFTPQVGRWAGEITAWSVEYGLPPEIIATVMQIESCGDPGAQSSAGAQGLFQVMPFHFAAGERPTDPQVNAQRGLDYLARSLQLAEDDLAAGFAGYNGGHALIGRAASEWPAETQRYARWATGIVREVRSGEIPSPTLQAWLAAGGDVLCQQSATVGIGADA